MARIVWIIVIVITCIFHCTVAWDTPEKQDYTDHPCRRDCLKFPVPRVCEYNFTLEHYATLSYACFRCPDDVTDCVRPHCVTAEGRRRAVKVVNRQMPGPAMHVCQGDVIKLNVYNQLSDMEGATIHWHGVLQEGTPHMDGVPMVTQCPIPAFSMFQYRFQATNPGTHYWHSHAGFQRSDGMFGALVVRETTVTHAARRYDEDLPEHTVVVQDWLGGFTAEKFSLHHHSMAYNQPSAILINGKGSSVAVAGRMSGGMDMSQTMGHNPGMDMPGSDDMTGQTSNNTYIPRSVFWVRTGRRYRFRLIYSGVLNCPLQVSIEDHTLTVVAADGYDTEPLQLDSIVIYAGQRYDFIVHAKQAVGNYWFRVAALGDGAEKQLHEAAILRYQGAIDEEPASVTSYDIATQAGKTLNPLTPTPDSVSSADMASPGPPDPSIVAQDTEDIKQFYIPLDFNKVANSRLFHPTLYPMQEVMSSMGGHGSHSNHMFAPQISHITNTMPPAPLLSQYREINEAMFCNATSVAADCQQEFCECLHRLKVGLGDIVEMVLVSEAQHGSGNHPMHLHGYGFYVLGMNKVNISTTTEDVKKLDMQGKLPRNLNNPIKKDTVIVPDGGYAILRFNASNPGFWLFHCHVEFHMAMGMSMVLQVGEVGEMPEKPAKFPRCGNWRFVDDTADTGHYTNSAQHLDSYTTNLLISLMVLSTLLPRFRLLACYGT